MSKYIDDVRQEFLNFFKKKGHQIISSSSLIPENDQTLFFTNSGMVQFKNFFLGIEKPKSKRVVTVQFCMRAGGKHNDLDNVGYTERHLTFFEMLGNFSFGDYFKTDTIQFAWELLTDSNWLNLSKDKIWVTTHILDNKSYDIWTKNIGISPKHIIKIGNKNSNFSDSSNFWTMGKIGPCGPCSEIFYDLGNNFKYIAPDNITDFEERYIEIWNLVFMQFNKRIDGTLEDLPILSVDTGMGLERITAILQGVCSNYSIDVFKNLIISISEVMKLKELIANRSLYVIADHIRACSFLIKEGVIPANEGRGYVLRRIIRRAVIHGKKLGVKNIFFYKLVVPLITHMSFLDNILRNYVELIENILFNEEKLFNSTLKKGSELLKQYLAQLKKGEILSGKKMFQLYATYGFPLELTKDICYENNIKFDQSEFDLIMLKEKRCSKNLNKFHLVSNPVVFPVNISTNFLGYKNLSLQSSVVLLYQNDKRVNTIYLNEEGLIILDITPFYPESGGQIGDCGCLKSTSGIFKITNTKKYGDIIVHIGVVSNGFINIGDQVSAIVDQIKRKSISINHSATHLLHAALLKILGMHILQKGSLIEDKYLRFDFSHYQSMTVAQVSEVESIVNQQIWSNLPITDNLMSKSSAINIGALMLSGKKYEETVRVLRIGNFSAELCRGTHPQYTGEIGLFIVIKEFGIGSGIRRIEAVTKDLALKLVQRKKTLIQNIVQTIHSDDENLLNTICEFKLRCNKLKKEISKIKNKQAIQKSLLMIENIVYIKDVRVLLKFVDNKESKILLNIVSHAKCRLASGIIILINVKKNNEAYIVISITNDLIKLNRINALNLINCIIHDFGGKGGGRADFAQVNINNIITRSTIEKHIQKLLNNVL